MFARLARPSCRLVRGASVIACAALATTLAACGDTGSRSRLSVADLPAIAGPAPGVPDSSWTEDGLSNPHVVTLAFLRHYWTSAAGKQALRTFLDAGFRRGERRRWTGRVGGAEATAEVEAFLFRDDSGARNGLGAIRELMAREPPFDNEKAKEIPVDELGEEAWGLRLSGGQEAFGYGSQRGNVVIVVFITCAENDGCIPGVLGKTTRAYAEEVVTRAE